MKQSRDTTSRINAGFSLVELSVATFLLGITMLIVTSVTWMVLGERRSGRQEKTFGDLSRQTESILRNSQKCVRLFKCNLNAGGAAINPASTAALDLPRGIADFSDGCAPSSSGTIAGIGLGALNDPSLRVQSLRLTDPKLIGYNQVGTGTFVSTVSYRLEAALVDVTVSSGTGVNQSTAARVGSLHKRPLGSSAVTLLIDDAGQVLSCENAGRSPASGASNNSYTGCSGAPISNLSTTGVATCAPPPTCPSAPVSCAAMRTAATSGASTPAVYFGSQTPSASQTASSSVCQDVTVTQLNGSQSGSTNVSAVNINQVFTQASGNLYLNADTVGDYINYTNSPSQTSIVANNVGNYQISYFSTDNCISAQNVSSVIGQKSISLYGRKNGGVRGTVGMINVGAGGNESVYVRGFEFTVAPVVQVGTFTGIDVKLPSFAADARELYLDGAEVVGLLQPSNASKATVLNTTVGGDFGMGVAVLPLTITSSIITGQTRISNNSLVAVTSSSLNGGLQIATSATGTFSSTKIVGDVTIGNNSVMTFNNGTTVNGNTTLYNSVTTTINGVGTVFTGNVRVTNNATLVVSGGARINGQVSGDLWTLMTFTGAGTTIAELALSGQQGPITLTNNAVITRLTSNNAVQMYTSNAYVINCTSGAKVLQNVTLSGQPVVLNNCN